MSSFYFRLLSKTIGYSKFDFGCLSEFETQKFLEVCHVPSSVAVEALVRDPLFLKENFVLENCFIVTIHPESFLVICKIIDLISYEQNSLYNNLFYQLKCEDPANCRSVLLHRRAAS